jgi:hypothetical protein
VALQEVRWEKGCTVRARDDIFVYGNKDHELATVFSYSTE